jgi:LDH2 family malate/lactate/ureidoglycolate dehydrogenase
VYVKRLQGAGTNPKPRIRTVSRGAWGAVLDGDACLGQVGASRAIELADKVATRRGLGFAICRNTSHVGALAPYLLNCMQGRVVIGMTNTGASIAAPGSNACVIGNNCIGFATPIRAAPPLCLDMTTSVESWGKIRDRIDRGIKLPPGIALAPDGSWATDPTVALAHTVVAPLGGGKGFGLALLIDVLVAGLSGGALSPNLNMLHEQLESPEGTCCAFLVFNLKQFPGGRSLPYRLAKWRQTIKQAKRIPGTREILLPGERSAAEEKRCLKQGFPITPSLRSQLNSLASSLNLNNRI